MAGARRWSFVVHDARGRRHRGAVAWMERLRTPPVAPKRGSAFSIILTSDDPVTFTAPSRTAVCVPAPRHLHALDETPVTLPDRLAELVLPPHLLHRYGDGRLIMANEGLMTPADIFPPHASAPRLDRLALALVEAAAAEEIAPYTALIRIELAVAQPGDAVEALGARLLPADPRERPPARAPAIVRLSRALRALRNGDAPETDLEHFAEDLRFLRLFSADEPIPVAGLSALLDDVRSTSRSRRGRRPAKIVPMPKKREGP